jgi:hypothetical protein
VEKVEKVDSGKSGKRGQIYLSTTYNDEAIDLLTTNRSNSCRYD